MNESRQERLGELFEAVLARPAADRMAALDEIGIDDPGLHAELRSLLAAHEEAPAFLEGVPERVLARALVALVQAPPAEFLRGRVGARYEILEWLGGGGMGVVYKARDKRLGRFVALKLLPPHLAADERARARLLTEAKAVSGLDHPNIAVVHEIDETEAGQIFISMAFHQGETLQRRLERGSMVVDEAVDLAHQMASALSATHRAGIVHRDIKPSNVLIATGGIVKILDFGIAKAAGAELTREGVIVGTVAYMSPEQTRGEVTDPRTDVWSLGAVLYEMLTGVRPFMADSTAALIHRIRHDAAARIEQLRPEIPFGVARIVETCLEKEAADRYDGAASLHADLASVLRGTGAREHGTGLRALHPSVASGRGRTRLVMLPLADDGSADGDAYFADAVTWELTSALSTLDRLSVTALSAALRYRGDDADPARVGQALGARALLMGSARKRGVRIRLVLRLVHPYRQEPLWTETYEGELRDLPGLQREITERVAGALQVAVQPAERRRLDDRGSASVAALEHYMRARSFLCTWDDSSIRRAATSFERALEIDPDFAEAWSGLALAHQALAGLSPATGDDAYQEAIGAAEHALGRNEELAEAHVAMATALGYHRLDATAAERHFSRAVALNPSHSAARGFYAELLRNQGRFDEALAQIHAAQELNPGSPSHAFEEGLILYVARRYDDALARLRRLLNVHAEFQVAYFGIALALVQLRRYDEALGALEVLDPHRQSPDARALRGYVYATTGRHSEAREMLASLQRSLSDPGRPLDPSPFHAAVIHVGLGELDRAIELLWELTRQRSWHAGLLKVEPMLDPLRSDPRFQRLLEEVGLHQPPPLLTPISRPR